MPRSDDIAAHARDAGRQASNNGEDGGGQRWRSLADYKDALKGSLCFVPPGTQRLQDLERCRPVGVMYTHQLNISPRRFTGGFPGVSQRGKWFAIDYRGHFTVDIAGDYLFRVLSDDGAILWIDGRMVVDNDGIHPPRSKSQLVPLAEGVHRLRLLYFQAGDEHVALQLFVTPPGQSERIWRSGP